MNGPIVLDTNAIISLFDGNRYIADMLGEEKSVIVPSIVCGEFEVGTQGTSRRERESLAAFNGLLRLGNFSVAVISRRTSRIYASLYASLKKAGTPIPTNDIWIAAVTIEYGGVLLTNDRHLLSVDRLRTVKY